MPTGLTSPAHLGVVLVVALVVLGPDRLPAALRQVAQFVGAVRRIVDDVNHSVTAAAPSLWPEDDKVGRTSATPHGAVTIEPQEIGS